MNSRFAYALVMFASTCLSGCVAQSIHPDAVGAQSLPLVGRVYVDTLVLLDTARNRHIPIAIYIPTDRDTMLNAVLLSHGYNENRPGTYLRFSSLCTHLANEGRVVVSIQHELPSDEPLPKIGDLSVLRRPNWQRGVGNIQFVKDELQRRFPLWRMGIVDLVGHSNGGDISMLFAYTYPAQVGTVVSLDNLRMPLPRVASPRVRSLRSNDAKADEGVLPTAAELGAFGILVEGLPSIGHSDMNDRGTAEQRAVLNEAVSRMLR